MCKYFFVLVLLAVCSTVDGNVTSTCGQKELCNSYLDLALDMIVRAKHNIPTCPKMRMPSKTTFAVAQPVDCADILHMGYNKSGIYKIWPMSRLTEGRPLNVYCDMDTDGGGWTVIQRRGDFGSSKDYFYQNWESYKEGFGDVQKDFWLGNDNIFALTTQKLYSVRFDLKDFQGNKRYALYKKFWIDDEDHKYALHITNYTGDAGDSMAYHNNQSFSTADRDTVEKCAEERKGGWWYNNCSTVNLNGLYHKGKPDSRDGIIWDPWKSYSEPLAWTEMKIRPKHFRYSLSSEVSLD